MGICYASTGQHLLLPPLGCRVPKKMHGLQMTFVGEPSEDILEIGFRGIEAPLDVAVIFRKVSPATEGPRPVLSETGALVPTSDKSDIYTSIELTDPSEEFLQLFYVSVADFEVRHGFRYTNPNCTPYQVCGPLHRADPLSDKNYLAGYVALFSGTGAFREKRFAGVPWKGAVHGYVHRDQYVFMALQWPVAEQFEHLNYIFADSFWGERLDPQDKEG